MTEYVNVDCPVCKYENVSFEIETEDSGEGTSHKMECGGCYKTIAFTLEYTAIANDEEIIE